MTEEYQLYTMTMNVLGGILMGTIVSHILILKIIANKKKIARGIIFALLLLPLLATKLVYKLVWH